LCAGEGSAPLHTNAKIPASDEAILGLHHVEQVAQALRGFTSDIAARVIEHKIKLYPDGFTAQYCFDMLVWYEEYTDVIRARMREVEIKGWRREKKVALIEAENPDWADLSLEWREDPGWKLEPEAHPRLKRKKSGP
jgi:putative endonuclease